MQLHLGNENADCHFSTGLCLRKGIMSAVRGKRRTFLVIGYIQRGRSSETTLGVVVLTEDKGNHSIVSFCEDLERVIC